MTILPYVIIIAAFAIFWIILMNRSGGGGIDRNMKFSKARTRLGSDEKKKVTFKDVAGADEEKLSLKR